MHCSVVPSLGVVCSRAIDKQFTLWHVALRESDLSTMKEALVSIANTEKQNSVSSKYNGGRSNFTSVGEC